MELGNYYILCKYQKNLQNNYIKVWLTLKMETILMNTENSKISEPDRFKLDFTDKLNLKTQKKKHGFS